MADIVIFPSHRRVGLIRRNAKFLASLTPSGREKPLALLLSKQKASLVKAMLSPAVVDREIGILETAIRNQIERLAPAGQRLA